MKIYSLNLNHDGSLFYFNDGKLIKTFEEQRITGTKHDGDPIYSLFQVLAEDGYPNVLLLSTTRNTHFETQMVFRKGNFYYELFQKK